MCYFILSSVEEDAMLLSPERKAQLSEHVRAIIAKVDREYDAIIAATEEKPVISPTMFFEIFLLCLLWKWDPENPVFATIDEISGVLRKLGLVNVSQRSALFTNPTVLRLFYEHGVELHYGTTAMRNKKFLEDSHRLVIALPKSAEKARMRNLRSRHIYLTLTGKQFAERLEQKYARLISREQFLAAANPAPDPALARKGGVKPVAE